MEDAADARFNVTDSYENLRAKARAVREGGPMDRLAEIRPADEWGKILSEGYSEISPGVVRKEFDIVLEDDEPLNEAVYDLFTKVERQITTGGPLFWRQSGSVNGHPRVMVEGPTARVVRFEELWNERQRPTRNGWIRWIGENRDEFQRVLWLLWDGDRSKLTTQAGERVRCYRCGATESQRWAVAYRVAEFGGHVPMRGYENEFLCKGCATPNSDTVEFIEEDA